MTFRNLNFLSLRTKISTEVFLHMRYDGTDCALICNVSPCRTEKVISRDNNIGHLINVPVWYSRC